MGITRQQLMNECDMLQGNVNRLMVTNDMRELNDMYEFACKRITTIYHENFKRLKSEEQDGNE